MFFNMYVGFSDTLTVALSPTYRVFETSPKVAYHHAYQNFIIRKQKFKVLSLVLTVVLAGNLLCQEIDNNNFAVFRYHDCKIK